MPSLRDRRYNEFITPTSSQRRSENSHNETGDSRSSRRRAELSSETEAYSTSSTHIFTPLNLRPVRSREVDRGRPSSDSTWRRDAENREHDEHRHGHSRRYYHAAFSRRQSRRSRSPGMVRNLFSRHGRHSRASSPSVIPSRRPLQNAATSTRHRYNTIQNRLVAQDRHYPYGFSPDVSQYPLSNIPAHVYIMQPQQAGSAGAAVSPMKPPASHTFSAKAQRSPLQPETLYLPGSGLLQQYPPTDQPSHVPLHSLTPRASAGHGGSGVETMAKIVASKHICDGCGRVRSHRFHDANPIRPGRKPITSFCRKCRDTFRREATGRTQTDASVDKSELSLRIPNQTSPHDGIDTIDESILSTGNVNRDGRVPEAAVATSTLKPKAGSPAGEAASEPQQAGTCLSPISSSNLDKEYDLPTVDSVAKSTAGCLVGENPAETSINKNMGGDDASSRQTTKTCQTRKDDGGCKKCKASAGEEARLGVLPTACACALPPPQVWPCVDYSVPRCVLDNSCCCHRRCRCSRASAMHSLSMFHPCCRVDGKQASECSAQESCAFHMQCGQRAGLSSAGDDTRVLPTDFQHACRTGYDAFTHEEGNNDRRQKKRRPSTGNKEQAVPEGGGEFNSNETRLLERQAQGEGDGVERHSIEELGKCLDAETEVSHYSKFKEAHQAATGDGVHSICLASPPFEDAFVQPLYEETGATHMGENDSSYGFGLYTAEPPRHAETAAFLGDERGEQHEYLQLKLSSDWKTGERAEIKFLVSSEAPQHFTFMAGRVNTENEQNQPFDGAFTTDHDYNNAQGTSFHHNLNGFSFPPAKVPSFGVEECGEGEDETESMMGVRRVQDCEVLSACGSCVSRAESLIPIRLLE